jgi:hypothetical protein
VVVSLGDCSFSSDARLGEGMLSTACNVELTSRCALRQGESEMCPPGLRGKAWGDTADKARATGVRGRGIQRRRGRARCREPKA